MKYEEIVKLRVCDRRHEVHALKLPQDLGTLRRMAGDWDPLVRHEVALCLPVDDATLVALAGDDAMIVRRVVAERLPLDSHVLWRMITDIHPFVRESAVMRLSPQYIQDARGLVARDEATTKGWQPSFDPDEWVGCGNWEGDADVPFGVPSLAQQAKWFLHAHKKRVEDTMEARTCD